MTGIDKITSRVLAEGAAEAEEMLRAAEDRAAAIRGEADREAERLLKSAQAQAREEARRRVGLLLSSAETESKKALLDMKQRLISEAFELALDRLLGMEKSAYISLLAGIAAKASETGTEEIILNEGDAERCGAEIVLEANRLKNAKLTLSKERRPIRGGLILSQGRIEINCSLETLVALKKNELAAKVAELLFSGA